MTTTTTTIQVTVVDDLRRAITVFHRPGCSHTHTMEVLHTDVPRDLDDLRSYVAEAKELGVPTPIAPCLRKEVRA